MGEETTWASWAYFLECNIHCDQHIDGLVQERRNSSVL